MDKDLDIRQWKGICPTPKDRQLLKAKTYLTRSYISQEKATMGNRIGVIGRFFSKKTDLRIISSKRIEEFERLLNYGPIRKFIYKNPMEVLQNK